MTEELRAATLSDCGRYRYSLSRQWDEGPLLTWVMLNPSTADADVDDPTIRRVRGFTRRLGHAGFTVVNLFALRSTDPRVLLSAVDPVGPLNDTTIAAVVGSSAGLVAGWGALSPRLAWRVRQVLAVADSWRCLGQPTRGGHPRHPLYLPGNAPLLAFRPVPPAAPSPLPGTDASRRDPVRVDVRARGAPPPVV